MRLKCAACDARRRLESDPVPHERTADCHTYEIVLLDPPRRIYYGSQRPLPVQVLPPRLYWGDYSGRFGWGDYGEPIGPDLEVSDHGIEGHIPLDGWTWKGKDPMSEGATPFHRMTRGEAFALAFRRAGEAHCRWREMMGLVNQVSAVAWRRMMDSLTTDMFEPKVISGGGAIRVPIQGGRFAAPDA